MTVCIAALCENAKTAIAITDRKMSSAFGDTESAMVKWRAIHPQWAVMFAGNEISPIPDILNNAIARLKGSDGSVEAARFNIAAAFQEVRLKRAEDVSLAPRGWTLENFKSKGRALLPEQLFVEIDHEIREIKMNVSLLVMGTSEGKCHLFSVENPGMTTDRSMPGFHAIGSGSHNALASLYQRGLRSNAYLQKALYYLYEAKQYAEKLGSVSEESDFWMMRPDETQRGMIDTKQIFPELEKVWKDLQPKDANLKTLDSLIKAMTMEPTTGKQAGHDEKNGKT